MTGKVFKSGRAWLGPEILKYNIEEIQKEKEQQKEEAHQKKKMEWQKKQSAIQAIQALNKELSQWNTDPLKTMVSYKKNKHDAKLLTKKAELL